VALFVPLLPGRNFQLKGSITSLQPLLIDLSHHLPILGYHFVDVSLRIHFHSFLSIFVKIPNRKFIKSAGKNQGKLRKGMRFAGSAIEF
jgi:hypothetical protein